MIDEPPPSFSTMAVRGAMGVCPKCGQGELFQKYLKQVEACAVCGEPYGHIRADDGPAWLTILVVGHVVVMITVALAMETELSDLALMGICCGLIVCLTALLLPCAKGVMIAAISKSGCGGSR